MFLFGDDDDFSFDSSPDGCGTTESFLCNTFRDGGLPSTPSSPPTPVKVIKLETTLSDKSPLVASTPFQSFVADSGCTTSDDERDGLGAVSLSHCERIEGVVCGGGGGRKEKSDSEVLATMTTTVKERPVNFSAAGDDNTSCTCSRAYLGKRKREEEQNSHSEDCFCRCNSDQVREDVRNRLAGVHEEEEEEEEEDCGSATKKVCSRPMALSLNGTKRINGLNGLSNVYSVLGLDQIATPPSSSSSPPSSPPQSQSPSPSEENDDDSSTPSPIDFTKVDPTLYDYDTKAPLLIPTQEAAPPVSGDSSGGSGTAPSTTSPDSSSSAPSSSSLPPVAATDAACPSESVTSPTLAITATSTTFSLPPPSSEYSLTSDSNHDCSASESCLSSAVESNLVDDPSDCKRSLPSSCSLEGLVSAQNGELVHNENERTDHENSISNGLNGGVPSSPEGAENDFLEDIVSLLMT